MAQDITVQTDQPPNLPLLLEVETEQAKAFAKHQHAPSTRKAYESDIRLFQSWCQERNVSSLLATPQTIAIFLSWSAHEGFAVSTLGRRLAALQYLHRVSGFETPTPSELVKATLKGIRRSLGTAPNKKHAATAERLAEMIHHIPQTLRGKRDKALLLLGFAGAFRRSELSALKITDIEETEQGLRIIIRQSKTDQEAQGQEIAIYKGVRLRPVEAVKEWLEAAHLTEGHLFRSLLKGNKVSEKSLSPFSISQIVKKYAALAGFVEGDFSAHSLRSGFITSAAERGASLFKMMEVSRHKSVDTLQGYVRKAELFKDHAGSSFL